MKFALIVAALLLNTVYCRPNNDDYDWGDGDSEDIQNDNYDEYDRADPGEDSEDADIPPPTISTPPQEFIARENETVALPCEASNADSLVTLWKKNNETIFQDGVRIEHFGSNYKRLPDRTLLIRNVGVNDTGRYSCSIPLNKTSEVAVTHHLTVQTPPTIISLYAANDRTLYEKGQTLELTCKATGVPQPNITWSLSGQQLATGETISIANITHHNAGVYQCLADNNIGEPAHKAIRIHVAHKPIVKIEKRTVNSDIELNCTVHAVPKASVHWKKGGMKMKSDGRVNIKHENHSYILQIKETQISDFGNYTCSASNSIGESERHISVTGAPSPAKFIKGSQDHDTKSPVLTWTTESISPIVEHELQYRKDGEATWNTIKPKVTNPDGNIYTIKQTLSDLTQGQYEVRVRSRNTYTWSPWSDHKVIKGVVAQRSHKHHPHTKTEYDVNHTGPSTKSLENEAVKENIREGASTTNGQPNVAPAASLLCILIVLLAERL